MATPNQTLTSFSLQPAALIQSQLSLFVWPKPSFQIPDSFSLTIPNLFQTLRTVMKSYNEARCTAGLGCEWLSKQGEWESFIGDARIHRLVDPFLGLSRQEGFSPLECSLVKREHQIVSNLRYPPYSKHDSDVSYACRSSSGSADLAVHLTIQPHTHSISFKMIQTLEKEGIEPTIAPVDGSFEIRAPEKKLIDHRTGCFMYSYNKDDSVFAYRCKSDLDTGERVYKVFGRGGNDTSCKEEIALYDTPHPSGTVLKADCMDGLHFDKLIFGPDRLQEKIREPRSWIDLMTQIARVSAITSFLGTLGLGFLHIANTRLKKTPDSSDNTAKRASDDLAQSKKTSFIEKIKTGMQRGNLADPRVIKTTAAVSLTAGLLGVLEYCIQRAICNRSLDCYVYSDTGQMVQLIKG